MNPQLNDILFQVAEQTLENLAFIFSFPEEDAPPADEPHLALGVSFAGPFAGRLVMKIATGVLPELAANMLGLEEEETSPEEQRDAAAETLNIVCGNLLPRIAGSEAVFNISSPAPVTEAAANASAGSGSTHARTLLALENGSCELLLQIDGTSILESVSADDAL